MPLEPPCASEICIWAFRRLTKKFAAPAAANIMAIYTQYRWRFRRQVQSKSKRWKGLVDADTWQKGYLKPGSAALREIDFWVGA